MHNFFTRIFLSFWLAIVLIAACAVAVTAIDFAAAPDRPATVLRAATEALNRDGVAGLRAWLAERNRSRPRQRTFVIDSSGEEILGQALPEFRRLGPSGRDGRGMFGPGPPPELRHLPPGPPPSPPAQDTRAGSPPPHIQSFEIFGNPEGRGGGRRWMGSVIRGADGSVYRLLFDPPLRRGPLAPPFAGWVRAALLAMALGVSGVVSYLLARSIVRPVRRLQAAAHTLSSGNLEARAGPEVTKRRDELGVLGREFDSMAERLGALIAARQRLLRDISHELRSPLARMEMAIGLARQDPASTPAQLDRVEREAERLDELIGRTLEYARLDRDPATIAFEEVDVAELVRQIVHDAEFESQSPPGRLRLTGDETLKMQGEPHVLHAAIDNVVRNALLHGDSSKPIDVTLASDAETVRICVRDYGKGVPEADLAHIFEPFYRSVTVGAKQEGSGIGLAITQRAAALHGGSVAASNAEGGGLEVTVTLPRTH